MSVFSFGVTSIAPGTGTADAVALTNGTYMALQSGLASGNQRTNILEVLMEGESTTSAVAIMLLARDSTQGATAAALVTPNSAGPVDVTTAALAIPVQAAISFTTPPQRATAITSAKLHLSINAFGGIIKWNPWAPNMSMSIIANTTPFSEVSLSAFTGSAVTQMSAHILYETA